MTQIALWKAKAYRLVAKGICYKDFKLWIWCKQQGWGTLYTSLHMADKAQVLRHEKRETCIFKYFFIVPKRPISFKTLIFYHLPHTADKAQVSRLQQQTKNLCFSSVHKCPVSSSMCLKKSCFLHTAGKDGASVYFFGVYMFLFHHLPHTADKAQASRLQPRKTCFIKWFSNVPKRPISSSMCINNSCLPHTAAKDRASVYFFGWVNVLSSPFSAHGC